MSLNRREIDLILSEWHLEGARVQEVYQPSIQSLYMELYLRGALHRLHVYLSQNSVRLHLSERKLAKPKKPQRFQQLLQSKIIGMYVVGISHVNDNRIVKIHLARKMRTQSEGAEKSEQATLERYVYLKLWSNNVNIVYTDEQETIIDLLYRSPKQQLMPGERFVLPHNAPSVAPSATTVREWSGNSFNQYIEAYYQRRHERHAQKAVLSKARIVIEKRMLFLHNARVSLEAQLENKEKPELYTQYGNAILQHAHEIAAGDTQLQTSGGSGENITIALNAQETLAENAQRYFDRAKKARRALENAQVRYKACVAELQVAQELGQLLPEEEESAEGEGREDGETFIPERVLEYVRQHEGLARAQTSAAQAKKRRGIFLRKDNFDITIGRNAIESDALLRTYARGEDIWMHVLGMKGGFVFLRLPRASGKTKTKGNTKSAPLQLLLECAGLAALFSKAKDAAQVDVMYTRVKHLRRVKNTTAQVLPAHTKTLHVRVDKARTQAFITAHEVR